MTPLIIAFSNRRRPPYNYRMPLKSPAKKRGQGEDGNKIRFRFFFLMGFEAKGKAKEEG